jgi:hypothetical protein
MKRNPFKELEKEFSFFKENNLKIKDCISVFPNSMQFNADFGQTNKLPRNIRTRINELITSFSNFSEAEKSLSDSDLDEFLL